MALLENTKLALIKKIFADEIRSSPMNEEDILVSYDVTALFTNVPLSETIDILARVARSMVSANQR